MKLILWWFLKRDLTRNKRTFQIDGDELTRLMIDHGVGVAEDASYIIKRLDIDYFDEG